MNTTIEVRATCIGIYIFTGKSEALIPDCYRRIYTSNSSQITDFPQDLIFIYN